MIFLLFQIFCYNYALSGSCKISPYPFSHFYDNDHLSSRLWNLKAELLMDSQVLEKFRVPASECDFFFYFLQPLLTLTLRNALFFSQGITDMGAHSCSFP